MPVATGGSPGLLASIYFVFKFRLDRHEFYGFVDRLFGILHRQFVEQEIHFGFQFFANAFPNLFGQAPEFGFELTESFFAGFVDELLIGLIRFFLADEFFPEVSVDFFFKVGGE